MAATLELLRERGYAGASIEGIAERAGVAKTTIYRSWPNRAALVVDAFYAATEEALAFPDTGSAREDFRLQIEQVATLLRTPAGAAFAAMVSGGRGDPELSRTLAERWVLPRKRWGVARLERAIAAGECRAGLDIKAALLTLYSPLYAPLLLGVAIPEPPAVAAYLDIVFRGIFNDDGMTSRPD